MIPPMKTALLTLGAALILASASVTAGPVVKDPPGQSSPPIHLERPDDRPADGSVPAPPPVHPPRVVRDGFQHVQVNVDDDGNDILYDAANEPSIAVDPNDPSRIAIGWRQFNNIASNFRQAGVGYSQDGGHTWTFPGVLQPGEFSSDPVVASDADGTFYYYALQPNRGPGQWACYLYKSSDDGATWPINRYAFGGDKSWFTIDRTDLPSRGHIYAAWSLFGSCCGLNTFNRSTDGGLTFDTPITVPQNPRWGTLVVGPNGEVYVVGGASNGGFVVARSTNAQDPGQTPTFDQISTVNLAGNFAFGGGPNPDGLLGQVTIDCCYAPGPDFGNLYVLASVDPPGPDPLDVHFTRSTDGGLTWTNLTRINDDPTNNGAWQWFGTMSVAPNGRIDVVWNDTRNDPAANTSELYYCSSQDGGLTWSENVPISPPFNHFLGYPNQNKLGDYYDMISDNLGAHLAWAATFTGGQDVYYVRIGVNDCNGNGIHDADDIADCDGSAWCSDCTSNGIPDGCEPDCDSNGVADSCDIADGTAQDCNTNAIPDSCDIDSGRSKDCNTNGTPDECETDCNDNKVPDDCDVAVGTSEDCNGNVVPDECETDCNANLIPDECDITAGTSADADGSDVPDECEVPTLFVQQSAAGANYGTTWTDPYNDLQDALRVAGSPGAAVTEIWVAAGTYYPDAGTGERDRSFVLKNGLALYGGFAGGESSISERDPAANPAVLNGDLAGDDTRALPTNEENSYHVVVSSGTDASAILDGFVITGGNADSAAFPHFNGGGILNDTGSPTINDCAIVANTAISGGGMHNDDGAPAVTNCLFGGNRSTGNGGGFYNTGGSADPLLEQCSFTANSAATDGGGVYNIGSGADLALINCALVRNAAGAHGGGVRSFYAGVTTLTNGILWANDDGGPSDQSAQIKADGTAAAVNYTCVQYLSGLGGAGNIGGAPAFIDVNGSDNQIGTADDDLRRGAGSACTDAGDNGAAGQAVDAAGNPRFAEDPIAPNTGSGTPPLVDMGPYEYQDDCNTNGVIDSVDLDVGTSADCNDNGVPDECEPPSDCNTNAVQDICDIALGTSGDCDTNGVPDECEPGCNDNGVPDACDIAVGTSMDCNTNAIPDECDIAEGTSLDCTGNGVPDECEPDCNTNGVADSCDILASTSTDGDVDGVPDECQGVAEVHSVHEHGAAGEFALLLYDADGSAVNIEPRLSGGGRLEVTFEIEMDPVTATDPDHVSIVGVNSGPYAGSV
ncbi:MAG TPA: sialidase family protein, partial [Phycisphaerae bacterium]|nr:sialidase family protein [Phycisphaerae bacterium]